MQSIAIQGGGWVRAFGNRDEHSLFLELDLDCYPDNLPGIAIQVGEQSADVIVHNIERSLRQELQDILLALNEPSKVYWRHDSSATSRNATILKLGARPDYIG